MVLSSTLEVCFERTNSTQNMAATLKICVSLIVTRKHVFYGKTAKTH